MPPTILQEKALKPETLPWVSSILSLLFIISTAVLSIIYIIDWQIPTLNTQIVAAPDNCSPIRFRCSGCNQDQGCTLAAQGANTIKANSYINLTTDKFLIIPTNSIVTVNICAGSSESILFSFNSTNLSGISKWYGYCTNNSMVKYHVGDLETKSNLWTSVLIPPNSHDTTRIIEYSMWKTIFFSNGTNILYQDNLSILSPINFCYLSGASPYDSYYCAAIRMSMISWTIEESRSGLLALTGIIGGIITILYRSSFWFLILLRRVQQKFRVHSKDPLQVELI